MRRDRDRRRVALDRLLRPAVRKRGEVCWVCSRRAKEQAGNRRTAPGERKKSLLADENVDRAAGEVPALANLVFEETLVRVAYVLREIGVKHESRDLRVTNLGAILDFDVFSFDRGGG